MTSHLFLQEGSVHPSCQHPQIPQTSHLPYRSGDLKLDVLKFTGGRKKENRTREALSVNIPSTGHSPTTLGFCPFLVWLCSLFTLILPVVLERLPLQGRLARHE